MTRVTAIIVALVTLGPAFASAQSLADVARAEEARRKAAPKVTKIYTNEDLKPDNTIPVANPAGSGGADTVPAAPVIPASIAAAGNATPVEAVPAVRDQAYWSGRINAARTLLDRTRMFGDALQSRISALNTDFVNRDDPAQRSVIEQDRNKALAELDRVKKEIDDQVKAIATIEDEARRAGVPAGWLR